MEVKYKAPKSGKSLLAKVAAKNSSKSKGVTRGGGIPHLKPSGGASGEGNSTGARAPKAKGLQGKPREKADNAGVEAEDAEAVDAEVGGAEDAGAGAGGTEGAGAKPTDGEAGDGDAEEGATEAEDVCGASSVTGKDEGVERTPEIIAQGEGVWDGLSLVYRWSEMGVMVGAAQPCGLVAPRLYTGEVVGAVLCLEYSLWCRRRCGSARPVHF